MSEFALPSFIGCSIYLSIYLFQFPGGGIEKRIELLILISQWKKVLTIPLRGKMDTTQISNRRGKVKLINLYLLDRI